LAGFFAGVALVLTGVAWLGFVVELMGFFALFGNYFPYVFSFVKTFGSGCGRRSCVLLKLTTSLVCRLFTLIFGRTADPPAAQPAGKTR
jgi:hypothetical protein